MHLLASVLTLAALAPQPTEMAPDTSLSLESELASLASAPVSAPLQDEGVDWSFSYTFLELGATRLNLDVIDEDADTYYARASLGLFKFLYVFLGYENQDTDFLSTKADLWRIGAGAHFGVLSNLDLVGDVAWLYNDISGTGFDETSNGYEVRLGGRWMPFGFGGGGLEIHGGGIWVDLEDGFISDNNSVGWDLGAKLHFLKLFSVGAVYTMLEDDDAATINARVSL